MNYNLISCDKISNKCFITLETRSIFNRKILYFRQDQETGRWLKLPELKVVTSHMHNILNTFSKEKYK